MIQCRLLIDNDIMGLPNKEEKYMENIKNILDYIAVSIVPIVGVITSFLTYLNARKKKKVEKQVEKQTNQENIFGDNIHYEDNRIMEIQVLKKEQQKISEKQQNIDDTSKFLSKYSFLYLLIIYVINVWKIITPIPKLPLISLNLDADTLIKHVANSLYRAVLPTTVNLLLLIGLMCLILTFKKVILIKHFGDILLSILYIFIALIYFYCMKTVGDIALEKINFSVQNSDTLILENFINTMLPFIIIVVMILFLAIAQSLISILFETKHSRPNFRIFRVAFPRIGFYLFLCAFPIAIVLLAQWI